jgi:hypothetical protein
VSISIEGGFRLGWIGIHRCPGFMQTYNASDCLRLFGFAHFQKSSFEYEQRQLRNLYWFRGSKAGDSRLL